MITTCQNTAEVLIFIHDTSSNFKLQKLSLQDFKMKPLPLIGIVVLFQSLILVSAYGTSSSGRGTTPAGEDNDHDHGSQEQQWGGVGQGRPYQPEQGQGQGRPGNNFGQGNYQSQDQYGSQSQHQSSNSPFAQDGFYRELIGYPENCVQSSDPKILCQYYVDIVKNEHDSFLYFDLSTRLSNPEDGGFVAIGLSKDKRMGEDDMVECVKMGREQPKIYHSWAAGQTRPTRLSNNPPVIQTNDNSFQFDQNSHVLSCKFRRQMTSTYDAAGKQVTIDFIRDKYYVLLTAGGLNDKNSDAIKYHGDKPVETGRAYISQNFLGYNRPEGQHGYRPIKDGSSGQHKLELHVVVEALLLSFIYLVY